jgi:hypothetical protein
MKVSELKKLFEKAEITKVKKVENQKYRVYVEKLNREFYSEAATEGAARDEAFDAVLNESDRIRGFELEDK